MMAFIYLVHAAIAVALLVALFRGRRATLLVAAGLVPLSGLVISAGVAWSWARLLPGILVLAAVLLPGGRPLRRMPGRRSLMMLVAWAGLVTLWYGMLDLEVIGLIEFAKELGWGAGQTDYRYPVQLLVWLGNLALLVGAYRLAANEDDARATGNGFVAGCLISVCVGGYQALAQGMGWPWLSGEVSGTMVGNLGLTERPEIYSLAGPLRMARLYGLGGEPKHTAAFTVLAILLLLSRGLRARNVSWERAALVVLTVGLGLTLSTSGWLALALGAALLVALAVRGRAGRSAGRPIQEQAPNRRLVGAVTSVGGIALLVAALMSAMPDAERDAIVKSRVEARLGSGFETIERYEPKDAATLALLRDRPEGLLTGYGAGGASFFLLDYLPQSGEERTHAITPTYTITRTISEFGIVGLGLWLLMLAGLARRARPSGTTFLAVCVPLALLQPTLTLPALTLLAGAFAEEEPHRQTMAPQPAPLPAPQRSNLVV